MMKARAREAAGRRRVVERRTGQSCEGSWWLLQKSVIAETDPVTHQQRNQGPTAPPLEIGASYTQHKTMWMVWTARYRPSAKPRTRRTRPTLISILSARLPRNHYFHSVSCHLLACAAVSVLLSPLGNHRWEKSSHGAAQQLDHHAGHREGRFTGVLTCPSRPRRR
jgi:hypothetical protein